MAPRPHVHPFLISPCSPVPIFPCPYIPLVPISSSPLSPCPPAPRPVPCALAVPPPLSERPGGAAAASKRSPLLAISLSQFLGPGPYLSPQTPAQRSLPPERSVPHPPHPGLRPEPGFCLHLPPPPAYPGPLSAHRRCPSLSPGFSPDFAGGGNAKRVQTQKKKSRSAIFCEVDAPRQFVRGVETGRGNCKQRTWAGSCVSPPPRSSLPSSLLPRGCSGPSQ